jgi:hypothetical protein
MSVANTAAVRPTRVTDRWSLSSQRRDVHADVRASKTVITLAVLVALYLLVAGPLLALCFYVISSGRPEAVERAIADVERFIELRERGRAELADTGSLDRFVELKHEARKHLWRAAGERAQTTNYDGTHPEATGRSRSSS